jgi:hypothetical protein
MTATRKRAACVAESPICPLLHGFALFFMIAANGPRRVRFAWRLGARLARQQV